jgi:hypothetical protein
VDIIEQADEKTPSLSLIYHEYHPICLCTEKSLDGLLPDSPALSEKLCLRVRMLYALCDIGRGPVVVSGQSLQCNGGSD